MKRFPAALSQIPSVGHFLELLSNDLANRRSTLVLLPSGIEPTEVWSVLQTELWRRDFWHSEVSLPELGESDGPVVALSEILGTQWPSSDTPRTLANLMKADNLPEIVELDGLHELPDGARNQWLSFLTQWAQASQSSFDAGRVPAALCVIAPAQAVLPQVPESSVYLAVHWWWGFPSVLELRLLCRLNNGNDHPDTLARWREYLLPALVGSDLSFAKDLWNDLDLGVEEVAERLCFLAAERGWTTEALTAWGAEEFAVTKGYGLGHSRSSPPAQFRNLWASGALIWTAEFGLELHTAALAALGRYEEVGHRLWRGQAELLLPLVDHLRLTICDHLTRSHGYDWPVRWHQPTSSVEEAEVRNSPLACGWGYLEWLLRKCPQLRSEQRLLPLTSRAHWIRNELAHYRPVTFRDFEGLWREIQRIPSRESRGW
jgi:hypothetical protein